jgi:hypothetical protein
MGRPPTRPWCFACVALLGVALVSLGGGQARADRYEATLVVRPTGTLGRVAEDVGGSAGSPVVASVYGGGLDVGLSYGLRNWLDVGLELGGAGFAQATYDPATVMISNRRHTGQIERTTRDAQLRAGATLRLGVAWVPTFYVGVGVGGRQKTAATMARDDQGTAVGLTPDDMTAGMSFDVVAATRIGFERRLDARWTVGLSAGASHSIGLGAPSLDTLSAGVSIACSWYPNL